MILTGTIVNVVAVLAGCLVGLMLGKLIPAQLGDAIQRGIALCVLYIGIEGTLSGTNALITILSMVLGVIVGELLKLDDKIHALGYLAEKKFAGKGEKGRFAEGFVSASLLFCVGAMAIVGSLESGLSNNHDTLYAKSMLDGITSIVYTSTMGIGVALSAVAVLLYQGAITLCAAFAEPYLNDFVIAEMKCVGSLLIIAIGTNMLGITKIKLMNYVPAIFFPILICMFF